MLIKFKSDEIILYEGIVNSNVKLTLTNERMVFEKRAWLFKKKYRVVDIISLNDIKYYKNNSGVKQKINKVIIQTTKKEIVLKCASVVDAKKIVDGILFAKTGLNALERGTNKFNKAVKIIKSSKESVVFIAGLILGIKTYFDNK